MLRYVDNMYQALTIYLKWYLKTEFENGIFKTLSLK